MTRTQLSLGVNSHTNMDSASRAMMIPIRDARLCNSTLFDVFANLTSRPSIVLAPSNGLFIFTDFFLNFLSSEEWINNFLDSVLNMNYKGD